MKSRKSHLQLYKMHCVTMSERKQSLLQNKLIEAMWVQNSDTRGFDLL